MENGRRIILSPQDIYNHLIKTAEEDDEGRSVSDTIVWLRENGFLLEQDCPYVGTFMPSIHTRKIFLKITTYQRINLLEEISVKKEKNKLLHKRLESAVRNTPVVAQMVWLPEMKKLKGMVYTLVL
uniref:Uncharacterized protein LOC101493221 n=1 Tax=Cicer arietinum TaxID=3827 RepID=A0A1S2YCK2_CICAR|nr:uncharacterized protein LOC101493221 [Cicer arietinum]